MKKIKNCLLMLAILIIAINHSSALAQTCATGSLSFTSGGTTYKNAGQGFLDNTGTFAAQYAQQYYYTIDRSGDFTTQNLQMYYYSTVTSQWYQWYPTPNIMYCTTSSGFQFGGTIPSTATCGQYESIKFHFFVYGGTSCSEVCSYTYYIRVPSQSINGPANMCSASNYSISSPVTLSGSFNWTLTNGWTFAQTGTSSYTGTLTTLTVNPPTVASTTTLTISGGNLCQSISKSITTNLSLPSWNAAYGSACMDGDYGYPVTWSVHPVTCATYYTWSYTGRSGGVELYINGNGLSCTISPVILGTYVISVVAHNSYASSSTLSKNLRVIKYDPIHCSGSSRLAAGDSVENNTDASLTEASSAVASILDISNTIEIYPNPASQSVNIKIKTSSDDNYCTKIYDMMGRQVYSCNNYYLAGSHEVNIDLKDLSNGIYYVIAGNSSNRISEKLIIAH